MTKEAFDMAPKKTWTADGWKGAAMAMVAVVVGFAVGILIGRFATCPESSAPQTANNDAAPLNVSEALMEEISNANIETYLRLLSAEPHVAGGDREHFLVKYIRQFWNESGLDDVTVAPYDVLLSMPEPGSPSFVQLLDGVDAVYDSRKADPDSQPRPGEMPAFLAFSASAQVEGDVVYVNYARESDFEWLEDNNINISGKIVIARYGKLFRGSKVRMAETRGAIGVLLYSDAADYANGTGEEVYPKSWWMPPSATQRGTILTTQGDPITPGYPSIGTAFRYKEEDPEAELPKIPALPISFKVATDILSKIGGLEAPEDWQGTQNFTYKIGPGFAQPSMKVRLKVAAKTVRKVIYNVFGFIRGALEPDRYVLFGNHRDAWVYGASDPSGGTAALLEVSRAMGKLVKSGAWRPRRSILFCSWGAEEFGLVGSTEWVEHYIKNLQHRAVAYVNVDIAVQGNYSMYAHGTPLMKAPVFAAASKVPCPLASDRKAGFPNVYAKWARVFPQFSPTGRILNEGRYMGLGSGSDYAPLLQRAGVTSVDLGYMFNKAKLRSLESYPLYHTRYENFDFVKTFLDRDFEVHRAVARVAAELLRHLGDSVILPFNVSEYAVWLDQFRTKLSHDHGPDMVSIFGINYANDLTRVIQEFRAEAAMFEKRIASVDLEDPLAVRLVNDQLLLLEKAFLDTNGLPLRPEKKHLIFAENSRNSYSSSSFPGLEDLLYDLKRFPVTAHRVDAIRHHFSVLLYVISSATSTLRDVTKFISSQL